MHSKRHFIKVFEKSESNLRFRFLSCITFCACQATQNLMLHEFRNTYSTLFLYKKKKIKENEFSKVKAKLNNLRKVSLV